MFDLALDQQTLLDFSIKENKVSPKRFFTQEVVEESSSIKLEGPCFVYNKCHTTFPSPLSPQKDRHV